MPAVLDMIRGRKDGRMAHGIATAGVPDADEKTGTANVSGANDSGRLSLEERNEIEIDEHPDSVTADAQIGQRKAEAAALVWSRSAVLATYGW